MTSTLTLKGAYDKGWTASKNTWTADLDAAEDRFIRRYGSRFVDGWTAGWIDYAADHDKYHSLPTAREE